MGLQAETLKSERTTMQKRQGTENINELNRILRSFYQISRLSTKMKLCTSLMKNEKSEEHYSCIMTMQTASRVPAGKLTGTHGYSRVGSRVNGSDLRQRYVKKRTTLPASHPRSPATTRDHPRPPASYLRPPVTTRVNSLR